MSNFSKLSTNRLLIARKLVQMKDDPDLGFFLRQAQCLSRFRARQEGGSVLRGAAAPAGSYMLPGLLSGYSI